MKGDFTRFTYDPRKHYTRVLKQQGRVDLDADWNEAVEIFTRRDRVEAIDVIGRCGVPIHEDGFKVETDGADLTISEGRIYVDGILCEREGPGALSLTGQDDLPGYELPEEDGVYLAYVDVWDRHITYLEDPEIREVALGGPDTTTRTRTVCQVRLLRIADDESLDLHECQPYPADPSTGTLVARAEAAGASTNPCAVPEGAGYTGLENRLYRVEIHDDGRDEDGVPGARPVTFKWSRDNGSVVLPIVDENGIDGDTASVQRLGFDEVLTVRVGDWVEIGGDATELHGRRGTLAQIVPDGIDRADLEVELDRDVSAHDGEAHLKMRRWDHQETDDLALIDGALPIPAGEFELEDGVLVEFAPGGTYHVGDYWMIPARTREGTVLWPREGMAALPLPLSPFGIQHHYCTLALVRRTGGVWTEPRDCRPLFPPLTEVGDGGCCLTVEPGDDLQQALDTVVAAGGGCVALCEGVHLVQGPLRIQGGADVKVHGEGAATVVRFLGTDEQGVGGLVVENGRRIALEDMFLASDDVPALVSVRHGPELEPSRQIAFRRLVLLNLAASDGETDLTCGIRLGHAEGVWIDACRIAAEVGILSLWGDTLSGAPAPEPEEGEGEEPSITLGFEDLDLGSTFQVGSAFTTSGITVSGEPFQWGNGQFTENGFARVDDEGLAGGSGQDLEVNNVNLAFALPLPYGAAVITFGEFGGNLNLRVNGDFRNVGDFSVLDGALVGGVRVQVAFAPDEEHGFLQLMGETADISDLALGGQELWIDDVSFRSPGEPSGEPLLEYGNGVGDLRMRDTRLRFQDVGLLVARAERWQIDRSDVQPLDEESWAEVQAILQQEAEDGDLEAGAGARARYGQVLSALEEVFAGAGTPRGYALLAFRWHACALRHVTLSGRHGAQAWWWLSGSAQGNEVVAEESGCHAFWLYEADWSENTVRTSDGLAFSFAGACRVRIEYNRLQGPIGIANLTFADALDGLEVLANALRRGYGPDTELELVQAALLHESFELMGLGPLMDALQPIIDAESPTPGTPATRYLAPSFNSGLRQGTVGGFLRALPIIDLGVVHNDIACGLQGVALDGFLPLGSLRIDHNRIHTTTGQAVRVETNPFFANAHLTVRLFRTLLVLLVRLVESSLEESPDGPLADILAALQELLQSWQSGVESLFDLDFRIEGNVIRSLRTAIESNLFELSVLTNHVTLQERTLATPGAAGTIFGRVLTEAGAPLADASVRAVGTERVVLSDASADYRMTGLPAGTYELRATQPGYGVTTAEVTVGGGEQAQVDFVLVPLQDATGFNRVGFSDRVIGERVALPKVGNPEIADVIGALEASPALEPLAVAMREGAHTHPEAYAGYLTADAGPLADAASRNGAADSAALIQGQSSDADLRLAADQLNDALRANDRTQLGAILVRFIAALQRYTDSQGILLAGVGVRVVENQVIVPADARADTEALGGVQISVNLAHVFVLSFLGAFLSRYFGGDDNESASIDPLLGITDTLLDSNEIVGGIGHGISVQGVAGQPDFVSDLRIRGNQIRGMAGAGVFVNEHALVLGLDVAHNHISDCGRGIGFTQHKGGLVVETAAVCAVQGNHVLRCGAKLQTDSAYGVDLDSIYGLRLSDNDVQANGSEGATAEDGGLRLIEVYGAALLHDNVVAFNRGLGLSWINSARTEEAGLLPPFLMLAVNTYLRMSRTVGQLVQEEQASLQGNVLKGVTDSDFPVFQLLNLREVLFSGNTCHAETAGPPLGEIQQAERGVVTHNQTQTNAQVSIAIKKMAGGVVLGNVGNRVIQLQSSAAVQHAFNVPPIP
jgi:hypothetical protein